MNNDGERYLHITLAFKEDELSPETLQSITGDFKQFVMSAYDADEFNFYAEAHLPKIKSYISKKTGDFIERKPHIHIVIPEKNLLSGQRLNPLGRVAYQTKFLEAFQEHANAKYGLASPKDNRRCEFTGESEIISRYKGDLFKGNAQALKERILSAVLERKITDYATFKSMLTEHGATRTRNAGTDREYENIKPPEHIKGVNLKDYVFSPEFIQKSHADKLKLITDEIINRYHSQQHTRDTEQKYIDTLNEWRDVRAPEIKYINSGQRKLYTAFKKANIDEKRVILAERAAKFYKKHRPEQNLTIHEKEITNERPDYERINADRIRNGQRAALVYQSGLDAARRQAPPQALAGVRNLSSGHMVHTGNETPLLLQANARDSLAQGRSTDIEMRRARAGYSGNAGEQEVAHTANRGADGVINQLQYERQELLRADLDEFRQIKLELDAQQLLDHLSQTHGVIPEKYEITQGNDGGDRIKAGSRNLNVSDFLTREMHLSFAEAAPILKREYERQQAQKTDKPLPARELPAARDRQRQIEQPIKTGKTGHAVQQAIAEDKEQNTLTANSKTSQRDKDYLVYRAQQRDETALAELRRQSIARRTTQLNGIKEGVKRDSEDEEAEALAAPILRRIPFTVDQHGNVTYYADEAKQRALVIDSAEHVGVKDTEDTRAIKIALRLAVQKWGANIEAIGSDEFKERCARVAADMGLDIKFKEEIADTDIAQSKTGPEPVAPDVTKDDQTNDDDDSPRM
ncbi:LPD7 domain-containing protein [Candidatus Methylospira mobilis]|nr:LPD7 domain-containing protein [Candidatus Methylospira mobilis]